MQFLLNSIQRELLGHLQQCRITCSDYFGGYPSRMKNYSLLHNVKKTDEKSGPFIQKASIDGIRMMAYQLLNHRWADAHRHVR
jgi:hypothetical protein